jgi:hypothetical protein
MNLISFKLRQIVKLIIIVILFNYLNKVLLILKLFKINSYRNKYLKI